MTYAYACAVAGALLSIGLIVETLLRLRGPRGPYLRWAVVINLLGAMSFAALTFWIVVATLRSGAISCGRRCAPGELISLREDPVLFWMTFLFPALILVLTSSYGARCIRLLVKRSW